MQAPIQNDKLKSAHPNIMDSTPNAEEKITITTALNHAQYFLSKNPLDKKKFINPHKTQTPAKEIVVIVTREKLKTRATYNIAQKKLKKAKKFKSFAIIIVDFSGVNIS